MERQELDELTREQLIALAIQLSITKPRSLTMAELVDEILSRTAKNNEDRARSRGFLGRARDLLAGVVERGLHLPEVTKALRRPEPTTRVWPKAPPPLATVTLAELYAGQAHFDKALVVLDEILTREPEHSEARALRQQIVAQMNQGNEMADAEQASTPNEAETNVEEPVTEPAEATEEAVGQAEPAAQAEAVAQAEPEAEAEAVAQAEPEAEAEAVAQAEPEAEAVAQAEPEAQAVAQAEPEAQAEPVVANDSGIWVSPSADPIAELPLPERYNVDEIVAIAVDPSTIYLYWEVRPTTFAAARAARSEGALVIRTVHVTPSWDGPLFEQRDLRTDALFGDAYVRDVRPGSNVRVAVGWLAHGLFEPFAIGAEVATSRVEPTSSTAKKVGRWTPESRGVMPDRVDQAAFASGVPPHAAPLEALLGGPTQALPGVMAPHAERLNGQFPTFDVRANDPNRAPAKPDGQTRGGASEIPRGGSSALVRPGQR